MPACIRQYRIAAGNPDPVSYTHLIAETIDSSRGFAELQRETIRTKCGFVLRAAAKAGLLS